MVNEVCEVAHWVAGAPQAEVLLLLANEPVFDLLGI